MTTDSETNPPDDPHLERSLQELLAEVRREDIPPRLRDLAMRLQEALAREADRRRR